MIIPKAITREDMYYSYIINGSGVLPKPITRKEMYLYYLCVNGFGSGGTVTPDMIESAVDRYLEENPVSAGATVEEVRQITKNASDIERLKQDIEDTLLKTTDYDNMSNKPMINGVELTGDKTTEDIGIKSEETDIDFSQYF